MRNRIKENTAIEDTTGMAGWMYSDLLIALMVIFLATITFIPQVTGSIVGGPNSATGKQNAIYNYSEYYQNPFIKVYDNFDITLMKQDIDSFLFAERLPNNTFVGSIQIIGGYDPQTEGVKDAIDRAVIFSNQIDKADPILLDKASTTISSSTNIKPDQIILRIVFIVNYQVKN